MEETEHMNWVQCYTQENMRPGRVMCVQVGTVSTIGIRWQRALTQSTVAGIKLDTRDVLRRRAGRSGWD